MDAGTAEKNRTRSWRAGSWVLRATVAIQCVGLFQIARVDGTGIGDALFHVLGWSESAMLAVELGLAWFCLFAGIATLAVVSRLLLSIVALWFLSNAVLHGYLGGFFTPELTVPAHAVRFLVPVGLMWWHRAGPPRPGDLWTPENLLRLAAAATFTAHGIEALLHNPVFIDYILTAVNHVAPGGMSQPTAEIILTIIGVVDIAVAVAVLSRRWRLVAGYMAFWGLLTAFSRIVHQGFPKWPATAVRAANAGVPLALYVYWRHKHTTRKATDQLDRESSG